MKENSPLEKLPNKDFFNPEQDLPNFLEDLKSKKYFDSYSLKKMAASQGNLFSCKILLKRLPFTIENPTKISNTTTSISIGFMVGDFKISTKSVTVVYFDKSSTKQEIEKEIMETIIKGIAKETVGYSETKRGLKAEQKVFDILDNFEKQGIIQNFRKADYLEDTTKKTDFVVDYKNISVSLQVKSSIEGREKHLETNKGKGVPSIVIDIRDNENDLSEKIIKILDSYISSGEILHL